MTNVAGCDSFLTLQLIVTPGVYLKAKVLLAGPYDASSGWMRDSLRFKGLIPTLEPYSLSPYNKTVTPNEVGAETVAANVIGLSGQDAIVDWIFLELRSPANASTIIATKRALVQRDGDIVSNLDGMSQVFFKNVPFNTTYYVSVKHRNHLGVMSASPINLVNCGSGSTLLNFTTDPVQVTIPCISVADRTYSSAPIGILCLSSTQDYRIRKFIMVRRCCK